MKTHDTVNHPPHYTHGLIETIEVTQNMNFCIGNAVKYISRCEHKGKKKEDLEKALWYLNRAQSHVDDQRVDIDKTLAVDYIGGLQLSQTLGVALFVIMVYNNLPQAERLVKDEISTL